jgi:protein tyrosine phosphatase
VTHFLFTGWPDHGVPQHPSSLLRFIGKVRAAYDHHEEPMIVHCSAGVGRSGTFIAIDSLIQRLRTMDTVNIYTFIRDMRHSRTHMVQTLDQYAFIHDSIFDYIVCGDTSIQASQLKTKLKELKRIHPDKGKTTLHEEYELLNIVSMSPNEEDLRLSERSIISRKNRYVDKYPYAQKYLYLLGRSATKGSEYINASFVNSYCNDNEFIAAQTPMENTVNDVWQLVWQFRCSVMVTLETENGCVKFWPDGKTQYDHILVKTASVTDKDDFSVYKHYVADGMRHSTALEVSHFHYKNWPKDGHPNVNTLIIMLAEVMKVKQGRNRPMLVMCDDGMDRTGTFICIASEIEHTKLEGTLDVFQSVKLGRCQRPHLVSSQENYFVCYETLLAYIESFDGYANFKDI